MAANDATLTPWASSGEPAPTLGQRLQQLQFERGHFRDITEESLRAEMAADENPESGANTDDGADEQDDEVQDGDQRPTTRQDLYGIRQQLLTHVGQAHQDIMIALDAISILESTYAPAQGAATISQIAKQTVPTASIGADVWARTPADPAREAQNRIIATNVRAKSLSESADSLLAAAARLQDNVRKEARYWSQIKEIMAKGWNVSRMPGQKHMCVHFGFNGSTRSGRTTAALIQDDEGNITLERGIGARPQAVRAILKRGNRVVGTSRLPLLPEEREPTLEARVRHARDSLFDEELYHEMIRESRTLYGQGVTMKGNSITFTYNDAIGSIKVELDLVSLDENNDVDSDGSQDQVANALMLTARLLLGRAHRKRTKQKAEVPAPMKTKEDRKEPLQILAPILVFMGHSANVHQINAYANRLGALLKRAQIPATVHKARVELPIDTEGTITTESLYEALFRQSSATASIEVASLPPFKLTVGSTPEDTVWHTFSYVKEGQTFDWTNLKDLTEDVDQYITDAVAQYLTSECEGWKFQPRSGLLVRKGAAGQLSASVELHTDEGTLELKGGNETAKWTLEDVGSDARSIVTALADIAKD
ncbi:Mediator of RNA polymerase II transcription subunit 17 [Cercospora beticola]|uniref:Mediator of RNA polymerase II transcription subunit 17 n=1 Tax=Cercospora beticola TaxID=122368 RepID=A0A2G5I0U8_CERBT|nr:Mediator of RNA polymerase II transcription subunit 17 [Cercospora beticola]PIA98417.1 Mediator of RNA polymerase II transcription subunit 17 [Cercospora beticola]WPA99278.1 hypothetical protein RHO25_003895 [Cercospora beticola]